MKRSLPFFSLILFSSVVVLFFYHRILFAPNDFMFSDSGDGIKNYFTYFFHIKHDTSCLNFEGMNYPYGEQFLYTDCHPLLASGLKWIGANNDWFVQNAIGILNLLMILSVFLTFLLIYWILVTFHVDRWFAVFMALGIGMLAPQLFRLQGHLALSYSVAIPITWLLIILIKKRNPGRIFYWMLLMNNLVWLFIHAYLGVILLAFQSAYLITSLLFDKQTRSKWLRNIAFAAVIIFPVLFFYFFSISIDTHTGRTTNPSGFFLYNAELDDVFLPNNPPLRPFLDKLTNGAIRLKWEAWSYVGMVNTLIFASMLILAVVALFSKKSRQSLAKIFQNKLLNQSLIAATIVLLFAMGIPFKQFPALLDIFPVFKQFRATGRFTWVFFFVATVFGAHVMQVVYEYLKRKDRQLLGKGLFFLAAFLLVVEGYPYHRSTKSAITRSPNLFRAEMLSGPFQNALEKINPAKYQAILPLPFYYQGSESFGRPRRESTVRASMVAAAHTGLPLLGANLTRTAIWESKNIVQVVTPNFYPKPIQKDIKDNRPFLIVRTRDPITRYEEMIFKNCDTLYYSPSVSFYSLTKDWLFAEQSSGVYHQFKNNPSYASGNFRTSDSVAYIFYNDYEDQPSEISFRGKGAFQGSKQGKNILAQFPPGTFREGTNYHSSIWMYNGFPDALNLWFRYIVEEYDPETETWYETVYFPEQAEVIFGNWSMVEGTFQVRDKKNWVYIITKGKEDSRPPFIADDLLIREEGVDVYRENTESSQLFFNNHKLELNAIQK